MSRLFRRHFAKGLVLTGGAVSGCLGVGGDETRTGETTTHDGIEMEIPFVEPNLFLKVDGATKHANDGRSKEFVFGVPRIRVKNVGETELRLPNPFGPDRDVRLLHDGEDRGYAPFSGPEADRYTKGSYERTYGSRYLEHEGTVSPGEEVQGPGPAYKLPRGFGGKETAVQIDYGGHSFRWTTRRW